MINRINSKANNSDYPIFRFLRSQISSACCVIVKDRYIRDARTPRIFEKAIKTKGSLQDKFFRLHVVCRFADTMEPLSARRRLEYTMLLIWR